MRLKVNNLVIAPPRMTDLKVNYLVIAPPRMTHLKVNYLVIAPLKLKCSTIWIVQPMSKNWNIQASVTSWTIRNK